MSSVGPGRKPNDKTLVRLKQKRMLISLSSIKRRLETQAAGLLLEGTNQVSLHFIISQQYKEFSIHGNGATLSF